MTDRFARTAQAFMAGEALLALRKQAIVGGWGREFLTYMLSVNLEMDRLAAKKHGEEAVWKEAYKAGVECARGAWKAGEQK